MSNKELFLFESTKYNLDQSNIVKPIKCIDTSLQSGLQQNNYNCIKSILNSEIIDSDIIEPNDRCETAKRFFNADTPVEKNGFSAFEMVESYHQPRVDYVETKASYQQELINEESVEKCNNRNSRKLKIGKSRQPLKFNSSDKKYLHKEDNSNLSHLQIAELFSKFNKFLFIDKVLHIYEKVSGIYVPLDKNNSNILIRRQAPEEIKYKISHHTVNEIVWWLRAKCDWIKIDGAEIKNFNKKYINFQNYTIEIPSLLPKPHNPEFYCTNVLNVNYSKYNGNFCSTIFFNVLKDMFGGEQNKIDLLQEIFAVTIANIPLKHFYYFVGVPDSGKSLITDLLKYIIGVEYTSALPWNRFEKEFALSELYRKRLNIAAESNSVTVLGTEITKRLTGNDYVSGNVKYEGDIEFYPLVTLIFTSNSKLTITDGQADQAFINRMTVLEFMNSITLEQQDADLLTKLKQDDEINAIIAWALEGVIRLYQNNFKLTHLVNAADYIICKSKIISKNKKENFAECFKVFLLETFEINHKNKVDYVIVPDILNGFKDFIGSDEDFNYDDTLCIHNILQNEFNLEKKRKKPPDKKKQEYAYMGLILKNIDTKSE